jgi:hypothetical protein
MFLYFFKKFVASLSIATGYIHAGSCSVVTTERTLVRTLCHRTFIFLCTLAHQLHSSFIKPIRICIALVAEQPTACIHGGLARHLPTLKKKLIPPERM